MSCRRELIHCSMIADADRVMARPGAILLEAGSIIAADRPEKLGVIDDAVRIDCPDSIVIPALVNTHAHLDLSHLGPVSHTGDFTSWITHVRDNRAITSEAIASSVKLGIEKSLAGGTTLIGDIAGAGSIVPIERLRESPLGGVSYIEFFGMGNGQIRGVEGIQAVRAALEPELQGVKLGLQPHAAYSCGPMVYQAAIEAGLPLSTHLAETLEELEFTNHGTGPLADMLRSFGVWDESIHRTEQHPIDLMYEHLDGNPVIAAHLNYIEDQHLERLADWPITVAYCPRASAYFGHVDHRYRDMLDHGVSVALGTDSLLCLDTPDRISVLDEMRFLFLRDSTDPRTLLRMATIEGAAAMGFDPGLTNLSPGPSAGLIAIRIDTSRQIDPLVQALESTTAPEWIL